MSNLVPAGLFRNSGGLYQIENKLAVLLFFKERLENPPPTLVKEFRQTFMISLY
jgi:hypothetical protein